MQPHFLALQGVAKLLETVQLVNKRMNPELKVSGIVLTMFDSQTKLSNEVVAELNGFIEAAQGKTAALGGGKDLQEQDPPQHQAGREPELRPDIIAYDPTSNGAADYRALARELLGLPDEVPAATGSDAPEAAGGQAERRKVREEAESRRCGEGAGNDRSKGQSGPRSGGVAAAKVVPPRPVRDVPTDAPSDAASEPEAVV